MAADQLISSAPHNDGSFSYVLLVDVYDILKLACGEYSGWAIPGNETRRAGSFASPSGKHGNLRLDSQEAIRACRFEAPAVCPARHHRLSLNVGSGLCGLRHELLRVCRAVEEALPIADAVSRMVCMRGNASRRRHSWWPTPAPLPEEPRRQPMSWRSRR